jgi:hypothetical protein
MDSIKDKAAIIFFGGGGDGGKGRKYNRVKVELLNSML